MNKTRTRCDIRLTTRSGITTVEIMVGAALLSVVLVVLFTVMRQGSRGVSATIERGDSLRSAMVAMESLHRDLSRMLFQDPARDLVLLAGDRPGTTQGLMLRVPRLADRSQLWEAPHNMVTYTLKPAPGSTAEAPAFVLARHEEGGESGTDVDTQLGSCLIQEMSISFLDPSRMNDHQKRSYLQLTITGIGKPGGKLTYTLSRLIPLEVMTPPDPYFLLGKYSENATE